MCASPLPLAFGLAFACLALAGFGLGAVHQGFGFVYEAAGIRAASLERCRWELRVQHGGTHTILLQHQVQLVTPAT